MDLFCLHKKSIFFLLYMSFLIYALLELQPKEIYLRGLALVTYNSSKMRREIVSCPETDLPNNIYDRLNELFKIKAKWTPEEITPYIMYVKNDKLFLFRILCNYNIMYIL